MSNFTNKNIMSNGSTIEITDKQLATFKSEADTWNAGEVERALDNFRSVRNKLLDKCDWTQNNDSPLSNSKKTEWATYRTNLRNLTKGLDTVEKINNVTFPTEPKA